MSSNQRIKSNNTENKVTPIGTLKSYDNGKVVEIPQYSDGQRAFVRLRRPSLLRMAHSGKIPNALLKSAADLFTKGNAVDSEDPITLNQMYELIEVMVKASLVEPTWEELEEAEITLTDEQMSFIFQYSQSGVEKLSMFRE